MDNLWAPWRMEFIQDKRLKGEAGPCVFCELSAVPPDDINLVLYRGKTVYIVMNRFPYTNGHLMIVSSDHVAELKNLSPQARLEVMDLTAHSMDILRECLEAQGFNCGLNVGRVAGAGILDHFHWHIVPRWNGDTNFLPVLADTRQMPEYLSETWQRLAPAFRKLGR